MRQSGHAHGIVTKTVHKTLPGGGGGRGGVGQGVEGGGGQGVVEVRGWWVQGVGAGGGRVPFGVGVVGVRG